jgi:hypothetical protein
VLHQDLDHRIRISDEVPRVELQLLELRVLADEILDRVIEACDNLFQVLPSGRFLDVEDDLVIYSKLLGDRQGIRGRASMGIVVNCDCCHRGEILPDPGAGQVGRGWVGPADVGATSGDGRTS